MRLLRLSLALAACLAVAGCIGGSHTNVQSTSSARTDVIAIIEPTTTPGDKSPIGELLKLPAKATPAASTPTAVTRPSSESSGPLGCIDQRLKALRDGKVLPQGNCS